MVSAAAWEFGEDEWCFWLSLDGVSDPIGGGFRRMFAVFFCRLANIGVGRLAKSLGVETVAASDGWLLVLLLDLLCDDRV